MECQRNTYGKSGTSVADDVEVCQRFDTFWSLGEQLDNVWDRETLRDRRRGFNDLTDVCRGERKVRRVESNSLAGVHASETEELSGRKDKNETGKEV